MFINLIFLLVSLFLLGFTEILVINEEVLLCLCFITFVFVGFASANIDVFNSLNQKPKDIKTTFLDSINNKLNFFSETNRWFFSNNWSSKSNYVSVIYGLWGYYELSLNLRDAKTTMNISNLIYLEDLWSDYSSRLNKSANSFILSSLYGHVNLSKIKITQENSKNKKQKKDESSISTIKKKTR